MRWLNRFKINHNSPTQKTATFLNFLAKLMLRVHGGRKGRRRMKTSVVELDAPERYGSMIESM